MSVRTKAAAVGVLAVVGASLFPAGPASADQIRDQQWHLGYLKIAEAHRITEGAGVKVAVLDTGTSSHPDFKRNLLKGTDTVANGDGSGRVDTDGHGTHMAGLIAGHGHGSGDGVFGVAPAAKIVPVKAIGKIRDNRNSMVAAIEWAAKSDVGVINVSASAGLSRGIYTAVGAASRADKVVVASAGNDDSDLFVVYPAAIPEVLAVGAVGRNGEHADFSVTGSAVDICAPGVDIVTTDRNNKYSKASGTSDATAVVSGAAALVRAKFPELSAAEVVHRLTATADDNGPAGKDDQCGYGVLNIVKALTADVEPLTPANSGGASVAPSESSAAPSTAAPEPSAAMAAPKQSDTTALVAGIGGVVAVLVWLAVLVTIRKRQTFH